MPRETLIQGTSMLLTETQWELAVIRVALLAEAVFGKEETVCS